jgi:hypothetical protein
LEYIAPLKMGPGKILPNPFTVERLRGIAKPTKNILN